MACKVLDGSNASIRNCNTIYRICFQLLCTALGISNPPGLCLIGLDILQGYYVFSQKLKHIVRLPFAATAYGTYLSLVFLQPHNLVLFEFFSLSPVILVQLTM